MKKTVLVLVLVLVAGLLIGCSSQFMTEGEMLDLDKNPQASITLSYIDGNDNEKTFTMVYELHYESAPITVTNFVNLIQSGFYNGTLIHNCSTITPMTATGSSLMYITGGAYKYVTEDENKTLTPVDVDYTIKGEFTSNGWTANELTHLVGSLVMDRTSGVDGFDSASSVYYMMFNDVKTRDGNYAVFGTLVSCSGKVGETEIPAQSSFIRTFYDDMTGLSRNKTVTDSNDKSVTLPSLEITVTMSVDTFGVEFPAAKTIKA